MKVYNVGKDALSKDDLEYLDEQAYEYFIYNYEAGCWDGGGAAVLKDNNGKFVLMDLGHCSRYGPPEERNPKCVYSLEEITKLLDKRCQDKYYGEYVKDISKKLKEMEG
jgi:hypothetical protein|nr:MAG TPA: hypothetical protein [Caudoviricetes sp.]